MVIIKLKMKRILQVKFLWEWKHIFRDSLTNLHWFQQTQIKYLKQNIFSTAVNKGDC